MHKNLYVIYGSDVKAKQEFVQKLISASNISEEFNKTMLRDDFTLEDIITTAQTVPFGAGNRCVIVYDFLWEKLKKKELKVLEECLNSLSSNTMLIFVRTEENLLQPAKKILTAVFAVAEVVELNVRSEQESVEMLQNMFSKEHIKINKLYCADIVVRCKNDPLLLSNEFAKLCAYAKAFNKKQIAEKDIDLMVSYESEQNIFKLGNAVIKGDLNYAYSALTKLFVQAQQFTAIVGSLRFAFSDLLIAKLALIERYSEAELQNDFKNAFKDKTFRIKNALKTAQNFSLKAICNCITILKEADVTFKTSAAEPQGVLQEVICKLNLCLHGTE
ncbi:MAG: DNA polymerase III subunit delta [Oscillospiraceae bacterium]